MKIDECRVVFSMKLNPKVVIEAASKYPDRTVLHAFYSMGILNVDDIRLRKEMIKVEKGRNF
jgi:hypothetical protein